jgi:hypothetical protein
VSISDGLGLMGLILALILPFACAYVARTRARNPIIWFLAGFVAALLFGALSGLIGLIVAGFAVIALVVVIVLIANGGPLG